MSTDQCFTFIADMYANKYDKKSMPILSSGEF